MEFTNFFSRPEVERIHKASLEVLENIGILVHNEKARGIYEKHGCIVDKNTGIVKFPAKVVEEYRKLLSTAIHFLRRIQNLTVFCH